MILFVNLHGGASYRMSSEAAEYASLAEAAEDWDSRERTGYSWKHLDRVRGERVFCPCWGDRSVYDGERQHAGFAWYVDPDTFPGEITVSPSGHRVIDTTDMYPDRELTVGPRGGLRWERC